MALVVRTLSLEKVLCRLHPRAVSAAWQSRRSHRSRSRPACRCAPSGGRCVGLHPRQRDV